MVFDDNYWMTTLSGCISVPSILRNTEHHWSCIGRYTNLYNNQRVHSTFSLVENPDLLGDRRHFSDKPITAISELSTANGVLCFVKIMMTSNGVLKCFRRTTKLILAKYFHFFII